MSALTMSRRAAMAGAASLAAAPAASSAATPATPIARLWDEVERLDVALIPHRAAIAAAEALRRGAAPGWMYLHGEPRAAAEQRYQALISILKETPQGRGDVALMALAARSLDIENGPRAWARARVAAAAAHAFV